MRRDELGILRFRYVRESEFDAIPEQNRDLYTRYVVFRDGSDEILYEYIYGQRLEFDKLQVVRDTQANIEALHSAGNISPYEVVFATDRRELGVSMDHGIVWFSPDASTAGFATIEYVDEQIASIDVDLSEYATTAYVDSEIANINIENIDLSDYATKIYVDSEIANIDLSNYIQNEDIKEVISGVSYNTTNHKITFNRYNDVDIVIDLPIEALLVGLSLDGDDLVLELEDGSTQRVPLNTLLVGVVKNVNGQTPNSNGEVNLNYTDLNNLPNLFSGNYEDLLNKPELFSKDYNDLINLPSLFSGNYEDLINKPEFQDKLTAGDNITIDPITNVISASGGSGGGPVDWEDIENKPDLFSKDYNDLTNKPAIPIKVSDLTNDTGYITGYTETDPIFTAWDKSTGISIMKSQVSDLIEATQALSGLMSATDKERLDVLHALLEEDTENSVVDSINEVLAIFNNYPEGADLVTALAGKVDKVTGKGLSTNDLTNTLKSNYDTAYTHSQTAHAPSNAEANVNADWNANSGAAQILNKPTLTTVAISGSYNDLTNKPNLKLVATTGSYNDLLNKPDLFSKDYNDLTNKPDLKVVATTGSYNDLLDKPSIPGIPDIPSKTSDLTNDSDFTTTTYVDDKDTIKEQNNNTDIKFWTGTQAEYNSLSGKDEDTIYFIEEV